jgi:tRNA A-37 threonylcarbamoyl transferase component Bud32
MADVNVKQQAINALTKAANESLVNKVMDLYKKRVEAAKALALIDQQIEDAIASNEAEIAAIAGK